MLDSNAVSKIKKMNIIQAEQPETIRSHQKDEFLQTNLRNEISRIIIDWFGTKRWIKHQKEFSVVADVAYFCLTTLSGLQTLGEEYCNLVQVENDKMRMPSLIRRCMMTILQSLAPYAIERTLCYLQSHLHHIVGENERFLFIDNLLDVIRQSLSVFSRVHLALFYINGIFYTLGKRITGIRYVLIRDFLKDDSAKESYKFLGKLFLLQFIILSPYYCYKIVKGARERESRNMPGSDSSLNNQESTIEDCKRLQSRLSCPLCLEPVVHTTATSCGHLFCWSCIVCWCSKKLECPVCRDAIVPSKLVYLCNFQV